MDEKTAISLTPESITGHPPPALPSRPPASPDPGEAWGGVGRRGVPREERKGNTATVGKSY